MRYILAALLLASCAHPPPLPPVAQESPVITPAPSPSPAQGALFRLYTAEYPPDGEFLLAILNASEDWNEATGREVFAWHEGKPVRLAQFPGIQREELPPNHITAGVTFPGLVVFSGLTPPVARYAVAAHELGHVIGLTHSTDPADLMFPSARKGHVITPNDARRAREALAERDAP